MREEELISVPPNTRGPGSSPSRLERPATFHTERWSLHTAPALPPRLRSRRSRTDRLPPPVPEAHGTPKHLNTGSEDQSDFQKTRQNNFDLHCYNGRSDESHWDTSRFNLDQVRIWSTLGETPPLNVRGFHGKELCVEKVLEDFGQRRSLGAIKYGRNPWPACYLELTVWRTLWTARRSSYPGSQMVLMTVLAAGLASFVLRLSSVRVLFLLFRLEYILLKESLQD